jgi:hypothetical protein
MKKLTLFVITLLGFTTLNAQDFLLKNSPFHFADATFNMSIEKDLGGDKSVNFTGGIHLLEDGWNYDDEKGLTAEIQLRKYVMNFKNSESKLNGVYVAPFGRLSYFKIHDTYRDWYYEYDSLGNYSEWTEETTVNASSKSGQAGIVMGVQYIMSDVILFDLFLGGGVQYAVEAGNRDRTHWSGGYRFNTGVIPKIGFNIGVKL